MLTVLKKESLESGFSLCMAGNCGRYDFDTKGSSVEAVLDRLPTAKIIREEEGTYEIEAEVYGQGVDMWVRSQGGDISEYREIQN